MSFPPRPPHGMPPGVIQQAPVSFNYPPMGMPPMGMMMNRPPPAFLPPPMNKPPPSMSPVTKVFVGNIHERAPDSMIRQMLQRCGNVLNWKRVEGTNGKLQAFGFCEFVEPQYTLRCIRLLNGYEIADKKLNVKVDQKTRELLADYLKKNRPNQNTKNAKKAAALRNIRGALIRPPEDGDGEEEEDPKNINLEAVDEDTLKEDRITIGALELILKQYAKDLDPPPPQPVEEEEAKAEAAKDEAEDEKATTVAPAPAEAGVESQSVSSGIYMKPHLRLEEIKLDEDKKEYMTSEISKFRETHKDEDLKIKQEERDRLNRVQERERQDRDKNRERRGDRDRDRDRERDRERDRDSKSRDDYRDREFRDGERRERDAEARDRGYPRQRSGDRDLRESSSRSAPSRRYNDRPSAERRSRSPREDRSVSGNDRRRDRIREEPERSIARSPDRRYNRKGDSMTRDAPTQNMTPEEIEEERERKKLERKLREKEMAYRARLKLWEEREEKKRRGYLSDRKAELQKRKLLHKEARKLRQFMEDYDDDKDDSMYFKGSSLEKKLKFREKEIESDNRDRQRERDELEELKKRLSEKGFDDVEHEAKRIQEDENVRMKIKFEKIDESSSSSDEGSDGESEKQTVASAKEVNEVIKEDNEADATSRVQSNINNDSNGHGSNGRDTGYDESNHMVEEEPEPAKNGTSASVKPTESAENGYSEDSNSSYNQSEIAKSKDKSPNYESYPSPSSESPTFLGAHSEASNDARPLNTHVTIKATKSMAKKSIQPINQAFADEDDEDSGPQQKRAKLLSESGMNSEERKKAVKKLVESIPTDRDELFAYKVDWDQLDDNLMKNRIKPWINKKIIEYIGEEEATLHDFICSKIQQRTEPAKLLEEIKVILDDEAELFVKKMWRLIVYETESKRCGLSR